MNLTIFIKNILEIINPWNNIKILNKNIKVDVISGITVAIIALPLALAFGKNSGLGPVAGIIGAISGGIMGGLFGGSLVSVSGPTAPTSSQISAFMTAYVISTSNPEDLTAIFSIIFLSGLIMVAISILKISKYIHYIPNTVVSGFMCGIGILVIISQINDFLGFDFMKFNQNNNYQNLYVSLPSMIILLSWNFFKQKLGFLKHVPAPFITLIIGTGIAFFFNLNIPLIGSQMQTTSGTDMFSNFYIPDLNKMIQFIIPAFTLAGLIIIDSLLTCVIADNLTEKRHISDKETFGQGIANMTSGMMGGTSTATATMFTVSNIKSGGNTPLSSIVYGLTLLIILLGLNSLVAAIPIACIAAILIKVGFDIIDYRFISIIKKISRFEIVIFIIVLLVTIFYDIMLAVSVGVLLSFIKSFKNK